MGEVRCLHPRLIYHAVADGTLAYKRHREVRVGRPGSGWRKAHLHVALLPACHTLSLPFQPSPLPMPPLPPLPPPLLLPLL